MNRICKFLVVVAAVMLMSVISVTEGSAEELQQLAEQLQKTPTDDALRARIIRLAAEAATPPSIPTEARRHFVMASTYLKEAKSAPDYALAIGAYQEALKLAPWWGDAYFNVSVAHESAGSLGEARKALESYLLTKPKDAEEAQNRIFSLEAKMVLAKKKSGETAAAEKKEMQEKAAEDKNFGWILGAWTYEAVHPDGTRRTERILFVKAGASIVDSNKKSKLRGTILANGDIIWERIWTSQHAVIAPGTPLSVRVNFSVDRRAATITWPTPDAITGEIFYTPHNSGKMVRD